MVQLHLGAPLSSIGRSSTSVIVSHCPKNRKKPSWPILGRFWGARFALGTGGPKGTRRKHPVESVVQGRFMKSGAGFHHSSSGEFQIAESGRAGDQEASESLFAALNAGWLPRRQNARDRGFVMISRRMLQRLRFEGKRRPGAWVPRRRQRVVNSPIRDLAASCAASRGSS
jgi:hypothetical protein